MIAALLAEDGFGLDDLMRLGVVFVFLVLPVIKKLFLERGAGASTEGEEADPEAVLSRERERAATEQWERLMRGEQAPWEDEPDAAGEVFTEAAAPVPPPAPAPEPRTVGAAFKGLHGLESQPLTDLSSTAGERAAMGGASSLSGDLSAGLSQGLGPSLAEASRSPGTSPGTSPLRRSASPRPDWRRAVVLSEVLSLPLALRKHAPWMGRT